MNQKFLEEATEVSKLWGRKYSRAFTAIMMESVRLRNEYNSDEEYQTYIKDYNDRVNKALEKK